MALPENAGEFIALFFDDQSDLGDWVRSHLTAHSPTARAPVEAPSVTPPFPPPSLPLLLHSSPRDRLRGGCPAAHYELETQSGRLRLQWFWVLE